MLLAARLYNPKGIRHSHALSLKHTSPDHHSYAPRRKNNPCLTRFEIANVRIVTVEEAPLG